LSKSSIKTSSGGGTTVLALLPFPFHIFPLSLSISVSLSLILSLSLFPTHHVVNRLAEGVIDCNEVVASLFVLGIDSQFSEISRERISKRTADCRARPPSWKRIAWTRCTTWKAKRRHSSQRRSPDVIWRVTAISVNCIDQWLHQPVAPWIAILIDFKCWKSRLWRLIHDLELSVLSARTC